MPDTPRVSVVVSTYNRCEMLPRTIDALLQQQTAECPYELIVVDNNSGDDTRGVLEGYAARYPDVFHHLFEPRQGVSYGRNAGIALARAPIVAFTDDDLVPAPNWIAEVHRALSAYPEIDYVGGKVLPWPDQQFPLWLTPLHWNPLMLHNPGEMPKVLSTSNPIGMGSGNLAIRKDTLLAFEGFSTDYPRGQDRELQLRLWAAGRRGLYVPGLIVYSNIQPDRLTKAFHRRWYAADGALSARLRDPDVERSKASFLDVPVHLYRQAVNDAGRYVLKHLVGKRDEAFLAELHLRHFAAFFRERQKLFGSKTPIVSKL